MYVIWSDWVDWKSYVLNGKCHTNKISNIFLKQRKHTLFGATQVIVILICSEKKIRNRENYPNIMPKIRRSRKPPPEGWELIEPTLEELEQKMREGKRIVYRTP